MPQINEERLAMALASQGIALTDARVIAAEAATAAAAVITPTPVPASAPAPTPATTITAPLTRSERKKLFVEQRAAELEAAGKPVNTVALEKRFDELAETTDGRAQITEVVQRAEPEILQAIVPDKVSIPAPAPTPAAETVTQQPPARTPAQNAVAPDRNNVRPEELAKGLFGGTPTPGTTSVGPTAQPTGTGGATGATGGNDDAGGATGATGATGDGTGATGATGDQSSLQDSFLKYIQGLEERRLTSEAAMAAKETERMKNDARQIVRTALESYKLPATLGTFIYDLITQDQIDLGNPDAILYAMRQRPEYQERFKANAERVKNGLSELDPSTYLALENDFKQVMRANGLPPGFYDENDDLAALIGGDTSPAEVQRRIEDGYNAVKLADPEVKAQMYNLYGVDDSQLVAYFLDPTRGESVLRRQTRAAQISAEGKNLSNMQLTKLQAEQLADAGVTQKEAQKGFGEIAQLGELVQTFAGETELSSEQLVGGRFGLNPAAQQELERKRRRRTAEFAGGGSFARTTGETSGSISTAVGKAQ